MSIFDCLTVVVKVLLLISSFYIGYKYGHRNPPCGKPQPTNYNLPSFVKNNNAITNFRKDPAVNAVNPPNGLTRRVLIDVESASESQPVYDHCQCGPATFQTEMALTPSTIVPEVFSSLHHPATIAKWATLLSRHGANSSLDKCSEVYLTRSGSRSNQPNKCYTVAWVPQGVASLNHHSHRYGFTALNQNQYQKDYTVADTLAEDEASLLPGFLDKINDLRKHFVEKMGSPIDANGNRRSIIVMVANEGVLDILLNFLCSAESIGIDMRSIVVFVGDQKFADVLEQTTGVMTINNAALGEMPKHAANTYLDHTFARMMWFKTTSQYIALSAGYNVLFQDVDLVWLINPFKYLQELDQDIIFMDDGARTPRYTPFFTNSGFYFIKYNQRTMYFQEKMMKCGPSEIGLTHSHQSVLIRHLAESVHLFGLKVFLLDEDVFLSGQAYHEKKKLIDRIIQRKYRPYVFHMCWTDNRVNKVVYFKEVNLWYINDKQHCLADHYKDSLSNGEYRSLQTIKSAGFDLNNTKSHLLDSCCMRQRYWPAPSAEDINNESLYPPKDGKKKKKNRL